MKMNIPKQEDVHMNLDQVQVENICHANDQMNINYQRIIFIKMPDDSILTNMRSMRYTEVTATIPIDENIDTNFNMN